MPLVRSAHNKTPNNKPAPRAAEYLEQSLVVLEHVCEQDVLGGATRQLRPQHRAIWQHQAPQQREVMGPRLVTHADPTAGDHTGCGV